MGVMDHRRSHGMDTCFWCGDRWPCEVARVRQDLADYLRKTAERNIELYRGDLDSQTSAVLDGIESAADLIDI